MNVGILGAGKMGEHVIRIMREHRFPGEIVAFDKDGHKRRLPK